MYAKGSLALARVRPDLPRPAFACPLCLEGFSPLALESDPPVLTLEHAPPQAVDPRRRPPPVALVCAACNSVAGYSLDADLARRGAAIEFALGGKATFRSRLQLGEESFAATVNISGTDIHVDVVERANRADAKERLGRALTGTSGQQVTVGIALPEFHDRKADLALLPAAYIACFAKLGYSWALHSALQPVRHQIAHPDEEVLEGCVALLPSVEADSLFIAIARDGAGEPFLLAAIGRSLVILPGGGQTVWDLRSEITGRELSELGTLQAFDWPSGLEMLLDYPASH